MIKDKPERIVDDSPQDIDTEATSAAAPTRAKTAGSNKPVTPEESTSEQGFAPLFEEGEADDFRSRWQAVQAGFVDQPGQSVERADELVATVINRLSEIFTVEREKLEQGWAGGDNVSTEDLRVALRRYRSFFDRLLSV
jgi:hypothetical protein